MKVNEVRRVIAADKDRIWAILTDATTLAGADTGITRIEGEIVQGTKIKLWADVAPGQVFKINIRAVSPYQMTWDSGMPLGLFKGVRRFALNDVAEGCEFHMREEYTGLMLPLIWRSMPDLQPSFDQVAAALAGLVEEV